MKSDKENDTSMTGIMDRWLQVSELAKLFGLSEESIKRLAKSHGFPLRRITPYATPGALESELIPWQELDKANSSSSGWRVSMPGEGTDITIRIPRAIREHLLAAASVWAFTSPRAAAFRLFRRFRPDWNDWNHGDLWNDWIREQSATVNKTRMTENEQRSFCRNLISKLPAGRRIYHFSQGPTAFRV